MDEDIHELTWDHLHDLCDCKSKPAFINMGAGIDDDLDTPESATAAARQYWINMAVSTHRHYVQDAESGEVLAVCLDAATAVRICAALNVVEHR